MAITLQPTSTAAAFGTVERSTLAAAPFSAQAAPTIDEATLSQFIEYEPPALPMGISATDGARTMLATADRTRLPDVPITYDVQRRTWTLLDDYTLPYANHVLKAVSGYSFDLSSIPRSLWWLIAPNELSIVAPLFHDLLYEYRGKLPLGQVEPARTYTRAEVDALFLHLMELEGVEWWRRAAAFSAVRAAGGLSWNK